MIENLTKHFTPIETTLKARGHHHARIITDPSNVPMPGVSALGRRFRTAFFKDVNSGKMM